MVTAFYLSMFSLSLIFTIIYICMWHKHFDVAMTLIFTLIPISNLGHCLYSFSSNLETAINSLKIVYIGGCFLQFFITLSIINLCDIKIKKLFKVIMFVLCLGMYLVVMTIGQNGLYYKDVSYVERGDSFILIKEYGIMHLFFYLLLTILFAIGIIAIIYSYIQKNQVSRRILNLLLIPDIITLFSYFGVKKFIKTVDFIPLGYIIAQITYLVIIYRISLYNIDNTVIDSLSQFSTTGYISFDFRKKFIGCNDSAKKIMPFLKELTVDYGLNNKSFKQRKIIHWLDSFIEDNDNNTFTYITRIDGLYDQDNTDVNADNNEDNRKYYNVDVNYLYDGGHKRGYIITLTDDTANRKFIDLLDSYNEKLKTEVDEKTQHIYEMHDNLILSLATMVESRDNSTGGHIKRTSVGVKILMNEIMKNNELGLTQDFCRDIIKAAPMHDLGKIAVDDAILRKPGRFTEEEFEKMKCHAEKGAKVIHQILEKTDDEAFKVIAENVAHYHHERVDGSGYPDGLKGDEIPIEARIMAIADVYDALVSKRVYKDSMSFDKADSIIMEGMGTQFDDKLKEYYVKARPKLEEYYSAQA